MNRPDHVDDQLIAVRDAALACGLCGAAILGTGTGRFSDLKDAVEEHWRACPGSPEEEARTARARAVFLPGDQGEVSKTARGEKGSLCPHCPGDEHDLHHVGCPTLGTCAQCWPETPPPWHVEAEWWDGHSDYARALREHRREKHQAAMTDQIDFSPRKCLICGGSFPPDYLGQHVLGHGDLSELWPGGTEGWLNYLLESIDVSLAEAAGHPEALTLLRRTKTDLQDLLVAYHEEQTRRRLAHRWERNLFDAQSAQPEGTGA